MPWGGSWFGPWFGGLGESSPPVSLGRFRLGDDVSLSFPSDSVPVAGPTADVTGPSPSNSIVETLALVTRDGGQTFAASAFLGQSYAVGTYTVTATMMLAGGPATSQVEFDVVAGGDPAGTIIAIHEHEGVGGRSVIVQTAAGRLLQGSNPWV